MNSLNNLAITATNSAMTSAMGAMFDTLQSKVANGGRDKNCKFYYNNGAGGSIIQVTIKGAVGGAVPALKDAAVNAFNSLLDKKEDKNKKSGAIWDDTNTQKKRQDAEAKNYGKMVLPEGTVYALDDFGCVSPDAIMLGIKTDNNVTITQNFPDYKINSSSLLGDLADKAVNGSIPHTVTSKTLVWYDTTALITINSDKNVIATRVQGRDYSRKELISNGDIKFSVSGQITSGQPDIYPTEEVKKFIKVMQYKGIIEVNNQILDQFGISHIVITNFNLSPRQGYKALQQYTFSAIGLQPEKEENITKDTIKIIPQKPLSEEDSDSEWMKMLNNQLEGLKSMASDAFSQGLGLASGMLDSKL